jgi:hypothetical protein
MVKDVFGDATESTRQSVLAAAKWRSMSDVEKQVSCLLGDRALRTVVDGKFSLQPYLTQADRAKREYDTTRKEYDERLRSLNEFAATSVLVYPASSLAAPTTAREIGVGMPDAALHK